MGSIFSLAWADVKDDPLRALFSAVGIAAIVMSTLLLNALVAGLSSFLSAAPLNTNLLLIDASYLYPSDSTIPPALVDMLKNWAPEKIRRVSPSFYRQLRINGHLTQTWASDPTDWPSVYNMSLVEGRWPENKREVVVGEGLAITNDWKTGITLDIFGEPFHVSGIYRAPGSGVSAVWLPMEAAVDLFGKDRSIQMITIELVPGQDPKAVSDELQHAEMVAGKFHVFLRDSYTNRNGQIVRDIYSLLALVSFLAMIAVPLSTYCLTLLNLVERGRVVAVLRALGFSAGSVHMFLIWRAIIINAFACFLGVAAAAAFIAIRHAAGPIFILSVELEFALVDRHAWAVIFATLLFGLLGAWFSCLHPLQATVDSLLRSN